jgi:hypothetical protein
MKLFLRRGFTRFFEDGGRRHMPLSPENEAHLARGGRRMFVIDNQRA